MEKEEMKRVSLAFWESEKKVRVFESLLKHGDNAGR